MNKTLKQAFMDSLPNFEIKYNEPLAPYTTWKIGGPAEYLCVSRNSNELKTLISVAKSFDIPVTVIGGGSNVLIADSGLQGLVIINKSRNIEIMDNSTTNSDVSEEEINKYNPWIQPRHGEEDSTFYTFEDLDYKESGDRILVRFDSGVDLAYATAYILKNQITGLQFFAGIPGTIGGALYNNIHGGTKHFSDYFYKATVWNGEELKIYTFEDFNFGYDQSILRENKDLVVVDVTLKLYKGDVEKAKFVANEWTKRKRRQPRNTAGCTFKNIPIEEQKRLGFPTPSVGYIVDKLFDWSGKKEGGAIISPHHSNFIENDGSATAKDVKIMLESIKQEAKIKYNLELEPEINLLGF